jgi:RimJ/RimL family protein N-acetyltransferase
MPLGPTLQTAHLTLRPPILDDLNQWVMTDFESDVARNTGPPEDRLRCHADMLKLAGGWALNGFGSLLLFKKDDGVLIGRVGPSLPLDWPEIEVGWALLPEFTGQGFALEGAAAAMDFALLELGKARVVHTIRPSTLRLKNSRPTSVPAIWDPSRFRRPMKASSITAGFRRRRNGLLIVCDLLKRFDRHRRHATFVSPSHL